MSDYNKLKYTVNDMDERLLVIASQITKSKSIEQSSTDGVGINIITGVSVSSGVVDYEITVICGNLSSCVLKLNDEIIMADSTALSSGTFAVRVKRINSVKLSISGEGLSMARLKLTGAGLKLT